MITWSEKKQLDVLAERVRNAVDGEEALKSLVEYINTIDDIAETKRLLKKEVKGSGAKNHLIKVVNLVLSGDDEKSQELRSALGDSINWISVCRMILTQIENMLSTIEVERDRDVLVVDPVEFQVYSLNDSTKIVDFSNGSRETKQFKIIRTLKAANGSMSAVVIADKVGGKSEDIRRSIPDINRRFQKVFVEDLVCKIPGTGRKNFYELNKSYYYQ